MVGGLYADFYLRDGIAGFWNDMNEPSVFKVASKTMPLTTVHRIAEPGWEPRSTTHAEVHNVFGMLNSKATYEGLLKLDPAKRPFVLTRASFAGGQRYAATWTGDNSATWNHMRESTPQLVNLGLSGFAFSGDDNGGYAGSPSMELLTRWLEVGAFTPIYRDHTESGTADQEPWVGGAEHEAIRRHYIEERYRLLPYLYTLAEEASRDGIPMMRPLFLEFPSKEGPPLDAEHDNQFLLGPDLMVAPPPFPDTQDDYTVFFPSETEWYDYWTGKRVTTQPWQGAVAASGFRVKHPSLDQLPIFVRAGSIIAKQPLVQSTDETPDGPLELHVYPVAKTSPVQRCGGTLYTDDGETFAFQKGAFYRSSFTCEHLPQGIVVRMSPPAGSYQPWWKTIEVIVYGVTSRPSSALLNGVALPPSVTRFDSGANAVHVEIPAPSTNAWVLELDQAPSEHAMNSGTGRGE